MIDLRWIKCEDFPQEQVYAYHKTETDKKMIKSKPLKDKFKQRPQSWLFHATTRQITIMSCDGGEKLNTLWLGSG